MSDDSKPQRPELDEVFRRLDPPPGGLARLRERLEHEDGARRPRRAIVYTSAAALGVALAIALAVVVPRLSGPPDSPDTPPSALSALPRDTLAYPSLVSFGLAAPIDAPLAIPESDRATTAITRVPVDDDRVVMYLIASTTPVAARGLAPPVGARH